METGMMISPISKQRNLKKIPQNYVFENEFQYKRDRKAITGKTAGLETFFGLPVQPDMFFDCLEHPIKYRYNRSLLISCAITVTLSLSIVRPLHGRKNTSN